MSEYQRKISVDDLHVGTFVKVRDNFGGLWSAEVIGFTRNGTIEFIVSGDDKVRRGTLTTIAEIVQP
jgi:hypothetical protein